MLFEISIKNGEDGINAMNKTQNIKDNISKISNFPFVVILGSGKSINDLTPKQLNLIEQAQAKIAINKFGAFYELAKIRPTHIYFQDDYTTSAILFLKHIFKILRNKGLRNLTFIVSNRYKGYLFSNRFSYLKHKFCPLFVVNLKKVILKLGRLIIKPISVKLFNKFKELVGYNFENIIFFRFGLLPKRSQIQFIEIQNWRTKGNYWAKSLNQKLFHYRGSFTTVLNYVSILYPNSNIILVGVDFNSPGYFFDNELNKLDFNTSDWTTQIANKKKKHFSIIDFEGTKMDDELPFIINELKKTNNKMYCFSKKSYLVKKGFVEYVKF